MEWIVIQFSQAGLLYKKTSSIEFKTSERAFSEFNNCIPKLWPFVIKCTIAPQNIKRSDTNNMKYIGQSVPRVDALEKVKGEAIFASDMILPGQAYLKMLMAHRPHAIVKRIDTSKAEALPGVLTVLTARDVPCNEFGYYTYDQPVFCGQSEKPYTDRVRFVGDRVAAVVAETEAIAAKARDLIEVEYEDLPVVCDVEEAMQPAAPVLHPDLGSNVFGHHKLYNGDIEAGFRQADVIVRSILNTPAQEHAFLQTESGLAYMDEDGQLAVVTTGQWGIKDRKQIAHALGLSEDQVRVIYPMTGGAFGGREDISVQIIVALAVLKLRNLGHPRPVKVIWSREESILGHCKRHPFRIFTRWGATRDGKIIAAEVKLLADGGAYKFTTSIVTSNAVINALGPYEIPNVKVDAYDVYTNHVPRGAFRGFGGPQAVYCAEQMVNKLAEALEMDPVELRMRNLAKEGSLQTTGAPFPPGVTIRETTQACAEDAGWDSTPSGWALTHPRLKKNPEQPFLRRGLGFACSHKNVGFSYGYPESCTIGIDLYGEEEIERAVIRHGASEVGMGAHTVITQMAAEAFGLPMEKVELISTDTAQVKDSGSVSASRMTFFIGNAIKDGAEKALSLWENEERPVHWITLTGHTKLRPQILKPDSATQTSLMHTLPRPQK
jgi:CO/xanthine dehydrogenase Mo-binding subunit